MFRDFKRDLRSFPDARTWSTLIGTPYITVSAKGIANGKSTVPNDGVDFGPDTPGTQTSGIQEAFNYAHDNGISVVYLLDGIFYISKNISLPKGIALIGSEYGNDNDDFYYQSAPTSSLLSSIKSGTWIVPTSSAVTSIITTNGNLPAQNRIENIRIEGMYLSEVGLNLDAGTEFPNDAISGLILRDIAVSDCTSKNIDISHNADLSLFNIHTWTKNPSGDYVLGVYDLVCNAPNSQVTISNLFSYSPSGLLLDVSKWDCNNSVLNAVNINGNYGSYYFDNDYIANGYQNILENGRINFLGNYSVNLYITNSLIELNGGTGQPTTFIDFKNNTSANVGKLVLDNSILETYGGTTYFYANGSSSQINTIYDDAFYHYVQISGGTLENYPISLSLSANPPVSGTAYQNTNPYDIEIDLPVYATTSGTPGTVAYGVSSSSTVTEMTPEYVSGDTSSGAVDIVRQEVPTGWYYEYTYSGVTAGTAIVHAR